MVKGNIARELVIFYVTSVFLCCPPSWAGTSASSQIRTNYCELRIGPQRFTFDPQNEQDLTRLDHALAELLLDSPPSSAALGELPSATERLWPSATARRKRSNAKKLRRSLELIRRQIAALKSDAASSVQQSLRTSLLETVAAVNNSQRTPLPEVIDTIQAPWFFFSHLHHPVGKGNTPAANLEPGPCADLSRLNPIPSTFWRPHDEIPVQDLYHGFGRIELPPLEGTIFTYARAKDSYGLNPGFEVEAKGHNFKIKFGEISSEPFVARIFHAVGFHADPTDYTPSLKVRYDRRIFQEFNSRQEMKTRFTLLGFITGYTLELQKRFDPFDYIAWAVLRNGTLWTGTELKNRLFHDAKTSHPEALASNFSPEIEAQIDYLITIPANVQQKQPHLKNIGPWDFSQLDHSDRRELRGAGLLAAWLGWFDTRFDNTRLRLVKTTSDPDLLHYFSDLGGALGKTAGLLYSHGELPNAFPWTFTRPPLWQRPHHLAIPLRIEGYRPVARTPAFEAMTLDDARWMARLIAQITEPQIVQALVASGFDSATTRLYTEKLVSRRDRMIVDLGLNAEIPLLRPARVDHRFSYDPTIDGPIIVSLPGEPPHQAPLSPLRVVDGRLVPSRGASPAIAANSIPQHVAKHRVAQFGLEPGALGRHYAPGVSNSH
jgi:hypothetical protein